MRALAFAIALVFTLGLMSIPAWSSPANAVTPDSEDLFDDADFINSPGPPPMDVPVRVRSGMLSVEAHNMRFGDILEEIGRQAGFETAISPEIASKKLSTDFRDMELQKGIQRLLSLISQRNYFMYYGPDNSITKIEVYETDKVGGAPRAPASSPKIVPPVRRTAPSISRQSPARTTRPVVRRSPTPSRPSAPARSTVKRRTAPARAPEAHGEDPDIPYIVPEQEPQFIPEYKRKR